MQNMNIHPFWCSAKMGVHVFSFQVWRIGICPIKILPLRHLSVLQELRLLRFLQRGLLRRLWQTAKLRPAVPVSVLRRAFVWRFRFRVLPDQGFSALPFLRFARTTATAIPATRTAPPVTVNGKTEKLLFGFSRFRFSESGFSVS